MFALIGRRVSKGKGGHVAGISLRREAIVLPRPVRRFVRFLNSPAVTERRVPRHLGSVLTLGFLSVTGIYGMILGGHADHVLNVSTAAAGFAVENVAVEGNIETSEIDILQQLGLDGTTSVMGLGAAEARQALLQLPWVEDAEVRKVYPNEISVQIAERKPFAIWQNGDELILIEKNGSVIAPMNERKFIGLPFYVGLGADVRASKFDGMIAPYPALKERVRAYVRVANRRWDLYLDNGVIVRLPEDHTEAALAELAQLDRERELLSRDIAAVDLRLTDRITIQLTDESFESRQAAIEQRDKQIAAMERQT